MALDHVVDSMTSFNLLVLCLQACDCNSEGSLDSQCDLHTGVCECKSGVGGDKCESCLPQFYNFTSDGCVECDCDITGSVDNTCHNLTGQSNCKASGNYGH